MTDDARAFKRMAGHIKNISAHQRYIADRCKRVRTDLETHAQARFPDVTPAQKEVFENLFDELKEAYVGQCEAIQVLQMAYERAMMYALECQGIDGDELWDMLEAASIDDIDKYADDNEDEWEDDEDE